VLQAARNLGPRKDEFEGFTFQDGGAALQAPRVEDVDELSVIGEETSHYNP
jgi:hypothetical protein